MPSLLTLGLRTPVRIATQGYCFIVAIALVFSFCAIGFSQQCSCLDGYRCVSGRCVALPACSKKPEGCPIVPPRKKQCENDFDCRIGHPYPLGCEAGRCVKARLQSSKGTFKARFCLNDSECPSGKCDRDLFKCRMDFTFPELEDGSLCSFGSQCASGNCSLGHCIKTPDPKPAIGWACSIDSQCSPGKCIEGKCAFILKWEDGSSCVHGSQCVSGNCLLGKCASPK